MVVVEEEDEVVEEEEAKANGRRAMGRRRRRWRQGRGTKRRGRVGRLPTLIPLILTPPPATGSHAHLARLTASAARSSLSPPESSICSTALRARAVTPVTGTRQRRRLRWWRGEGGGGGGGGGQVLRLRDRAVDGAGGGGEGAAQAMCGPRAWRVWGCSRQPTLASCRRPLSVGAVLLTGLRRGAQGHTPSSRCDFLRHLRRGLRAMPQPPTCAPMALGSNLAG